MESSSTADKARRPLRLPLLVLGVSFGLLAVGVAVWWLGPWSAPFRYSRTDLVSLRRTVERNPKDYAAWREMGLRLARDGDPLAYGPLHEAFALNPNDAEVGTGLGELLLETKRYPEAFQVLKAVTSRMPKYALARMALGRLYKQKSSFLHASTEFEAVTAADPKNTDAWYELAICYLQMQQSAKAQAAINECLKRWPDNPQYLALKGSIDAAVGNVDTGIEATKKAAELAPRDVKIQATLVSMLLAHHRSAEDLTLAEQVIGRLEQLSPDNALLPYHRGELERLRQNWPAAVAYLERAVKSAPTETEIYFSLGQVYQRLNRKAEADRVLDIYHRRQDLQRRIEDVRIALGSDPNKLPLYAKLIDLQLRLGDRPGAASSLQAAYDIDPKSPHIRKYIEALKKSGLPLPSPGS
jgi:tetratricopeptide (TPR) repeat protein